MMNFVDNKHESTSCKAFYGIFKFELNKKLLELGAF